MPESEQMDADVLAHCQGLKEKLDKDADAAVCLEGEKVFYAGYHKAVMPGHIYSPAGVKEYNISHLCEYHFDETAKQFDEAGGIVLVFGPEAGE